MSHIEAGPLVVPELVAESRLASFELRTARTLHWSIWIGALAVLAAAALLEVRAESRVVIPGLNRALPELCYWRVALGGSCPGCGLTRCFISAAHGDLHSAWRFSPVGLLLFAAVLIQVPYRPWQLWRLTTGRGEFNGLDLSYAMLVVSVLLLLQWFWRLLS